MAIHLLNAEDNEHVTIHELRGFISDDLKDALMESYAISRATQCKKFLYSLSLSPPEMENVPVEAFEKAIAQIEAKLGFEGQPRAIVFHEKEGRRHAHCVWSRIDVATMKAIDPSYDKLCLRDISREIYLEHGWKMPRGL
ncbi:MAG: relaxase/mobilization nuclease domain-containing protein, partial [Cohaesibacter sp.]|nr:relaxase/mobilization nuclease domain-containing protein [Cohaesibacter sp.]